jgi:hypothetical protein
MGSFEDHVRYGVAFYAGAVLLVSAPVAYLLGEGALGTGGAALAAGAAVLGFPFALAGASFPDVDHHSAKPHRLFRRGVSVAAAVVSGYVVFASGLGSEAGFVVAEAAGVEVGGVPEAAVGGVVAVAGGIAAAGVAFVGVGVVKPRHRGVTHTVRAGAVVAGVVGAGFGYAVSVFAPSVAASVGGVAAAAFFVGFLSHLQCDGMLVGFLPDAMG